MNNRRYGWLRRCAGGRFGLSLAFLLSVHLLALVFFTLFRLALFCAVDYAFPPDVAGDFGLQGEAFVRGVWFDNVIACYILLLPLVMFWVAGCAGYTARWLYRTAAVFFILFYTVAFTVTAANIPYFAYFFKTINSSIFNWFGYAGTTAGMIFGETSYYLPMASGLIAILVFGWAVVRLSRFFGAQSERAKSCKGLKIGGGTICDGRVAGRALSVRHPWPQGL